jgi:alpha-tubulin suppressor-like RCC1 family protein
MGIQNISSLPPSYVSISGKYSFNTSPKDECVKGEFVFKTIEPIKWEFGSGIAEDFLCSKSGKFQVNNATFEFSSQGITITVTSQSSVQSSIYSCKDVGKLCKYEPLPTLTIAAITAGTVVGGIGGEEIGGGETGGGTTVCPVWYKDSDNDGYTDGTTLVSCTKPYGYVASAQPGDCDDEDNQINPGKTEICDEIDNNCNGLVDEGVKLVFYKDLDRDGYTDGVTQIGCTAPTGYVLSATLGDCNDNDIDINPGKTEICDSKDNNCNGEIDEGNVCVFVAAKVTAGGAHTCAIKQDGSLWCWGYNWNGQLGDGTYGSKKTPIQIMSSGVSSIALGVSHTCAIKTDGSLWCWGYNLFGRLGDGTDQSKSSPVQIISSGVVSVALGGAHTCAIKQDGSLWCWGANVNGQLGDGTYSNNSTPVQIMSSGVVAVALGGDHTCAIKQDGSLWCWGDNYYGQIGDGTRTSKGTPVQIMSSGVVAVALGGAHTCAIKQDGSLWCWGWNWRGQLGDGSGGSYDYDAHRSTPVQIMSSGVVAVALAGYYPSSLIPEGGYHTCAIKTDGSLWCWGGNYYGQLGDGTNESKNTPVQIMSSGVSSVALGGYHTCAIKQDGSLWCWGRNSSGQLGDGTNINKSTPVRVINPSGSGGGGAPYIVEKISFRNMEQEQANTERKQTIYGCSSANIIFHIIYLIFPAFILFALLKKRRFVQ